MPIKWSAIRVSRAMDEIEMQLQCAQPFIDSALTKAREAKGIPNLPGYIDERLNRLVWDIEHRFENLKGAIDTVRKNIPEGAIEAEQQASKHGNQQSMI